MITGNKNIEGESSFSPGDSSGRTGPAKVTIVLAVVLLVSILAAQVIVTVRGKTLRLKEAGARLIGQVAQQGLSHYLGNEPIIRCYLLETDGDKEGFGILRIRPTDGKSDKAVFAIEYISSNVSDNTTEHVLCEVSDDMRYYEYIERGSDSRGRVVGSALYRDGDMIIVQAGDGPKKMISLKGSSSPDNIVPPPLIDFFSSLVAGGDYGDEVHFSIPIVIANSDMQMLLLPAQVVGGLESSPENLKGSAPAGPAVTVTWPSRGEPGKPLIQAVVLDAQHQLLWQKDSIGSPQVNRAVTEAQLLEAYPQAATILQKWGVDSGNKGTFL
jgi:hypothetical protein